MDWQGLACLQKVSTVGANPGKGAELRLGRASLLAAALIAGLVITATALAGKDFRFSTNPPDKQYDYFHPGRHGGQLLHNVEQAHLVPGIRQLAEGDFRHAHNSLDFVLRWYPNHPRALNLYSQLAMKRGQPDSALAYLDYALRFRPRDLSTHIIYGIHRYRMGDFRKAAGRFREALDLDPQSAEAHYNLGLTYVELREYDKARAQARKAYDLGYPLPGLREKLRDRGEWPRTSTASAPR